MQLGFLQQRGQHDLPAEARSQSRRRADSCTALPRSGRSMGICEVVYKDPVHAAEAVRKYHNVALDGQKLEIRMMDVQERALSSGLK